MPAFNSAKFIAESIESVLAQTYPNWELIIVDDGSTDNTAIIAKTFVSKDSRIKYIYQENGKQGKARNNGLNHASGDLIAFLDSDDLWMPNKLELQLDEIEKQNVDLVFSDGYLFNSGEEISEENGLKIASGKYYGEDALLKFIEFNRVPILSVLVKKDAVSAVEGFDERPELQNCEDYHLWLKLLNKGFKFYGSGCKLVKYRLHPNSATANNINLLPKEIETLNDFQFNSEDLKLAKQKRLKILYKNLFYYAVQQKKLHLLYEYYDDLKLNLQINRVALYGYNLLLKFNHRLFLSAIWRFL